MRYTRLLVYILNKKRRLVDLHLKKTGLKRLQWQALAHIVEHKKPMNQKELLKQTDCDSAQLTRAVHYLCENDYLNQAIAKEDKRNRILTLTTKGQQVANDLLNLYKTLDQQLFAGLSTEEINILTDLTNKVANNAEQLGKTK